MSGAVTLKLKGVIQFGSNVSGKGPGGVWLPRGPFGPDSKRLINALDSIGPVGFSINGGRRITSYVGREMKMSKSGTPFYGIYAKGYGGTHGRYPPSEPLLNFPEVKGQTSGKQYLYIKPSVLSTKGMLETRFRWINNGQYPNNWVQPVYPNGTQSDNASQWLYVQKKAAANICVNDTNTPEIYVDHIRRGGATGCNTTPAFYRGYDAIAGKGLYSKTLTIPQDASQYTLQVQRPCANPGAPQRPFPYATSGGASSAGSLAAPNSTFGRPPPVPIVNFTSPPAWYTQGLTIAEFSQQQLENQKNFHVEFPKPIFANQNIFG